MFFDSLSIFLNSVLGKPSNKDFSLAGDSGCLLKKKGYPYAVLEKSIRHARFNLQDKSKLR